MQTLINILKLNDIKRGTSQKTGRPYEMQDAECLLLNDDGTLAGVGVLQVPRELMSSVAVGIFTASFALKANFASRRIEAVLTGLVPVPGGKASPSLSPAPRSAP